MLNTGDPGYSSKRPDDGSWSIIDRETGGWTTSADASSEDLTLVWRPDLSRI